MMSPYVNKLYYCFLTFQIFSVRDDTLECIEAYKYASRTDYQPTNTKKKDT